MAGSQTVFLSGEAQWEAARAASMDRILLAVQESGWTLGEFLKILFTVPQTQKEKGNPPRHAQMVSVFLQGRLAIKAQDIVELMYSSRYSAPLSVRKSANREASAVRRPDPKVMANWCLREWAISKAEAVVNKEAEELALRSTGFHLDDKTATWDFILNFSMESVLSTLHLKSPTLLRLLKAAAVPVKSSMRASGLSAVPLPTSPTPNTSNYPMPSEPHETVYNLSEHFSNPPPSGSGHNRHDPLVIIAVACMLLLSARNSHVTMFQKMVGVWLFAHTAPHGIYSVLGRVGLSVSYTTVLKLLGALSDSAKNSTRRSAQSRAFLLIYDNINRMARAWDPDLGQKDKIHNGTAATYVELADCDVEKAFDVGCLRQAQQEERRKKLSLDVLYKRIDWEKLNLCVTTHILRILVQHVDGLAKHRDFVQLRFRTTLAIHRMRAGRQTSLHPLATSDYNEGNTAENAKVLDDLILNQLKMGKDDVTKYMVIVGGDQSTVEKLRTLKRLVASCPHGYPQYGWVLPLIQLWHMGWADLERVLSTHWGKSTGDDLSSLRAANVLLGRKVKDQKRPDYYPALHLVFDNLDAEVLDCWRYELGLVQYEVVAYTAQLQSPLENVVF